MSSLSKEEKDLLLDFYFKCGSDDDLQRCAELIAKNPEAAELFDKLDGTLCVMDDYRAETCPDYLVEDTLFRLKELSNPSTTSIDKLILRQKAHNRKLFGGAWTSMARVAAIAAVALIVTAIYMPATSRMRQMSWKAACQNNLGAIASGLAGYAADNDGYLPKVNMAGNNSWWKVGSQDEKDYSNTRNIWLLVKGRYVPLDKFSCPGSECASSLPKKQIKIENYQRDFPGREFVDYSFKLVCNDSVRADKDRRTVFSADSNPLFDDRCSSLYDSFRKFRVTSDMLSMASRNHARKGQNVLFSDGSVKFSSERTFFDDDIYTVRNEDVYSGSERPSCNTDIFLAP